MSSVEGSDEPKSFTGVAHQRRQRHRPRLAALAAAEREHLLDEIARARAGKLGLLEIFREPRHRDAAAGCSAASTT